MADACLIDSSLYIDVATADPEFGPWSKRTILELGQRFVLVTNQIIIAEVYRAFNDPDRFTAFLNASGVARQSLPFACCARAADAFGLYRKRRRKTETSSEGSSHILPDFLIGAHAEQGGMILATRDPAGFRSYFPSVALITP